MAKNLTPQGFYNAVASRVGGDDGAHIARWGYSAGEKKTKQVLIYFKIVDGEEAGTVLPWFGFFSTDAARRTVESLRYCGFAGDDLLALDTQPLDQVVQIVVGHNEWDGKTYARVDWVNAAGGGAIKLKAPMAEGDLRAFSALMKNSVAKVPEVKGEKIDAAAIPTAAPKSSADSTPANGSSAPAGDGWVGPPATEGGSAIDRMDDIPF